MKGKLGRRLPIVLAVIVLVPVVLALIGGLLLPKDRFKREVAAYLAEATGAEVELGTVGVKFWPRLALSLDGGTISGTGPALARATGSATDLRDYRLQLARLDVQVGLRPLLSRDIEVRALTLAGPLLEVSWDGGRMEARDFRLSVTDLSLPVQAARQAAAQGASPEAAPGETIPYELAFAYEGAVDRLILQDVPYEQVEFQGDLDALILTLASLTARRATGVITASGEIDWERDRWGELDFEARAEAVPAGSLLEPWAAELAARLSGDLDAEVSGTCNLRDSETVTRTLSLVGRIRCGEGVLAAADWLQDVAPYLGRRQDLKNVRFGALDHAFRVDQGKYLIENLHIDGHDTDWRGSGWVSLDGEMDARVQVKLPAGFTPELGRWSFLAETLRDQDGRVNLVLHLTGPSVRPRVVLDPASLQSGLGEGTTDAVKKGLGGLLDKWKTR